MQAKMNHDIISAPSLKRGGQTLSAMWRGVGTVSGCRRVRYHRSASAGPHSTHSTAALPNDVWVCPAPRYCDSPAGPTSDPEKPIRGIRMDNGVAGQISL